MCNYQTYRHGYAQPGYGWRSRNFGHHFKSVPVNIEALEDRFQVYLFAPSLQKENIKVSVKDDILTIAYQSPDKEEEPQRFTRREYRNDNFERSFLLNGKVDTTAITVTYTEGILLVVLPKNPQTNQPSKDFKVD